MKRYLLMFALFFASLTDTFASNFVEVTVDIPINNSQRAELLQNSKAKAVHKAIERLPSVIWGEQQLRSNHYQEHIKAIGFAHAYVDVLTEILDTQNNRFEIKANVSWDEEKILATLDQVQEGQAAKRTVAQIEKILEGVSARDFLSNAGYRKLEEARLLANPFHFGMDMTQYVQRYQETLVQMIAIKRERVVDFTKLVQITPKGMRNKRLVYELIFPEAEFLDLSFESEDLQGFYDDNKETIDSSYTVCQVSPAPVDFNIKQYLGGLKRTSRNNTTVQELNIAPIATLLKGLVEPIYFFTCK